MADLDAFNIVFAAIVTADIAVMSWTAKTLITLSNRITRLETMAEFFELSRRRASDLHPKEE